MPKPEWPVAAKRTHIGKSPDRADGPAKATGTAKYSYDMNRPNMLWAKVVTSPHPRAEVVRHAHVVLVDRADAHVLQELQGRERADPGEPGG